MISVSKRCGSGSGPAPEIPRSKDIPTHPVDKERFHLIANPGAIPEVIWNLQWSDTADSWDVLGGSPITAFDNKASAMFSTSAYEMIEPNVRVTVNCGGWFWIKHAGALMLDSSSDDNSIVYAAIAIGVAPYSNTIASWDVKSNKASGAIGAGNHWQFFSQGQLVMIPHADTFNVVHRTTGVTPFGQKKESELEILPVRILGP